jgi:hypothetical protein
MKNLLAFTAFLAVGFLLGSRRAVKPVSCPTADMVLRINAQSRAQDIMAICRGNNYRNRVTD